MSGNQTIYVISDLHLGGDKTYAICTPERGQKLLRSFLLSLCAECKAGRDIHLVVNGDSVDFLGIAPFSAFTVDDALATKKLSAILDSTPGVWEEFSGFVQSGGTLTFLLGNHDIELALPGPRSELMKRIGPGKVTLLTDGRALSIGDVLIKHGNQYDRWNYVDYQKLATFANTITSEEPAWFEPPAGSRLVHQIMNGIKKTFSFINLLKPENQAAIPFLGVLNPSCLAQIPDFVPLYIAAEGTPIDTEAVARAVAPAEHPEDRTELDYANQIVFDEEETRAVGAVNDWFAARRRTEQLRLLGMVVKRWFTKYLLTFDTLLEQDDYLKPASLAAKEHGYRLIVYGHTHLAKRVAIAETDAMYLNTGTWADLLCIPDSILLPDSDEKSKERLEAFATDLQANRLENWVTCMPTYARIEMQDGRCVQSDLLIWKEGADPQPVPNGRLSRLYKS